MADTPNIGTHLATLNLFREQDGCEITVAGGSPALSKEWAESVKAPPEPYETPLAYTEALIADAAFRMAARRNDPRAILGMIAANALAEMDRMQGVIDNGEAFAGFAAVESLATSFEMAGRPGKLYKLALSIVDPEEREFNEFDDEDRFAE